MNNYTSPWQRNEEGEETTVYNIFTSKVVAIMQGNSEAKAESADLLADAPAMLRYIASKALGGCKEAQKLTRRHTNILVHECFFNLDHEELLNEYQRMG